MKPGEIRIGVGGWTYAPWRGTFYPEKLTQKSELEYASRQLTSIEINGTYYGSQKPATFVKWHDETPDDFVFSVKAPRFATNRTVLADAGRSVERFFASGVMELKSKLGPINWQFMPTKKFDPADFDAFLQLLPTTVDGRTLRHAVEVRHSSFRSPDFLAMARKRGVAVVIAGDSDYLQIADATAAFVYIRIMGTKSKEAFGYTSAALDRWAARAQAWASGLEPDAGGSSDAKLSAKALQYVEPPRPKGKPRDVYVYVISGHKQSNPAAAMSLISRVGK